MHRAVLPALLSWLLSGCGSPVPLPKVDTNGLPARVAATIHAAEDTAKQSPRDSNAVGSFGMVLHAHQQFDAAAQCYTRASQLDPEQARWHYYLGLVLFERGDFPRSLSALQQAASRQPNSLPMRLKYAELLLANGQADASRRVLEDLAAFDHPAIYHAMAKADVALQDWSGAARAYEHALEKFPLYTSARYGLANALRHLGDSVAAARHQARAEREQRFSPVLADPLLEAVQRLNATGEAHIERSLSLAATGDLEQAVRENLMALEKDPSLTRAHINLISLLARLGRFEESAAHYKQAVDQKPDSAEAHYNQGVALVAKGAMVEAATAFRLAISANPKHADSHHNLAWILEQQGDTPNAVQHYRAAIEYLPGYRMAHYHLGRLLAMGGNYREALPHLKAACATEDEKTPGFLYGLATAEVRLGNQRAGLEHARRARQLAITYRQGELAARLDREIAALNGNTRP